MAFLKSRNVQRLFLAFTTGLFLACAARVSAHAQGSSSRLVSPTAGHRTSR
jgi:hypothetical protein